MFPCFTERRRSGGVPWIVRTRTRLLVRHHELRPVGRGPVFTRVVADVVVARVVVVVEVEVDAELRRPGLVDRREARGVEAAGRPVAVVGGVGEARRLDGGRGGLEVARLERRRAREAAAVWTSTQQVPWVVKGLVPESVPRRRRRVTERIVAPSGIDEVSKETTVLYCLSWLLSPTRSALVLLRLASSEPPTLEVSLDSSTQPSWAADGGEGHGGRSRIHDLRRAAVRAAAARAIRSRR